MKAHFAIFTILLSGARPAFTQSQPSTQEPSSPYTLELDAEEVVLNCTVLDSKGQLVDGLNKSNFKVVEDKIPQTIISLQHQDTPVSIGLLVDNSGSMRPKRASIASAALDLIKASNPGDETFVINFSDRAYLDQDFTSDLGKLQDGLAHLSLSGGTAIYDTVVTASDKMERTANRPRKALIIITDGEDNASQLTLDNAIRRVQDMHGPIIYSIGLLFSADSSGGDKRRARHSLETLSIETGGIAFFPKSLDDVDAVAAEVARDIRNQYTLAYHSARAPIRGYHSVKVEAQAPGHGKLTVHTRTGYYSKLSPILGGMTRNKSVDWGREACKRMSTNFLALTGRTRIGAALDVQKHARHC
jgi:Ca-activated chloride channel homolog